MLLPIKRILFEYHALVLKKHQDVGTMTQVTHNLELICDLEVMLGICCIFSMLEGMNELIKLSQFRYFLYVILLLQSNCVKHISTIGIPMPKMPTLCPKCLH